MTSRSAGCVDTTATLTISDGDAAFAPGDATWLVTGHVSGAKFKLVRSQASFDKKNYSTTLDADRTEAGIRGVYSTPFCSFDVALSRY